MRSRTFTFTDKQGFTLFVYHWSPDNQEEVKGVVQIAHGMTETAQRYERFARFLTDAGYMVYANDHRGHGKTAGSIEKLGYVGHDGFVWMVNNMAQLSQIIRDEQPNQPLFLFAHSMGSFLGQKYMYEFSQLIDGIILSGSNGSRGVELLAGLGVTHLITAMRGDQYRSRWIDSLAFGSFNRHIQSPRTQFDWLSRDPIEVDKFIDDPYCGGVSTTSFYRDFFKMLREIQQKPYLQRIPKDLPVFIIAGDQDPVGMRGKGVRKLVERYEELQLQQMSYKLYQEGRHELLNDINRKEVMQDCLEWLNKQVERTRG
ncbi:alpha/beta fold hydrolase [Brevibacillus laterosporus]|uniref:alpha/beta fold hydrolase n=1 Tax=Brevibacillus laterosporus TaxID=1465 RepID=UPI00215C1A6E|nr:alpha/beta hydrolase [Brevibacillus laterosporus]MCR8994273.1 alpha/beta hydrolase [Brevibacillus laterosporus]